MRGYNIKNGDKECENVSCVTLSQRGFKRQDFWNVMSHTKKVCLCHVSKESCAVGLVVT